MLFPSQCGFRKDYSAQNCLLVTTERFNEAIDRGDKFGTLLVDPSKEFDCINYSFLIAKIDSYGILPMSTKIIFSFF